MKVEQRSFSMHSQLLFDVIRRQSGTLDRAILEGVMNAVDAGADEIRISVSRSSVTIVDNGDGFRDREQITTCFETFGQPHERDEEKVFGTFRMGRGQLFAFGINRWQSNNFCMDVDIANLGLDYDLTEYPEAVLSGCSVAVSLYNPLTDMELSSICNSLKRDVRWLGVGVFLNGKLISHSPKSSNWDEEDDVAYYKYGDDAKNLYKSVDVYNMGVFVRHYSGRFERSATVVTKKHLALNFARNDVMHGCPVWQVIGPKVLKEAKKPPSKHKHKITEYEKRVMARQVLTGEADHHTNAHGRFYIDVTGKQWSAAMIFKVACEYRHTLTVCPKNDPTGVKLFRAGMAFVLAEDTLVRFGSKSLKDLMGVIGKNNVRLRDVRVEEFIDLENELIKVHRVLGDDELTAVDRAYLLVFRSAQRDLLVNIPGSPAERKLVFGKSHCWAWGDGETYIALDLDHLNEHEHVIPRAVEAAHAILHEYCHDTPTVEAHDHSKDFFGKFYAGLRGVGPFVSGVVDKLPEHCRQLGLSGGQVDLLCHDITQNEDSVHTMDG